MIKILRVEKEADEGGALHAMANKSFVITSILVTTYMITMVEWVNQSTCYSAILLLHTLSLSQMKKLEQTMRTRKEKG